MTPSAIWPAWLTSAVPLGAAKFAAPQRIDSLGQNRPSQPLSESRPCKGSEVEISF
jgi:hypothetical protein